MPYGGNDWLALTQEAALEPEIPICDPHHHFWDFRSERIPYQRYLLHELAADVNCGHDVRSTVFIEARSMYRPEGPVELRPVGEVEFVQGLGRRCRYRALWALPGRVSHHRPRRSEAGRSSRAGAGGITGRQPQPVSRHPAHGDLGPIIRNREP